MSGTGAGEQFMERASTSNHAKAAPTTLALALTEPTVGFSLVVILTVPQP